MTVLDNLHGGRARKPSLVDDAYQMLKAAIRENLFPPGYQASEQEIALRLGMSRTPVHEAVIRLQQDGLVRVLAKKGILICSISTADMREIYDVIIAFESMAAELLAGLPSAERKTVIGELTQLNAAMQSALERGDLVAWAKGDDQFHQLLIERCGNGRIRQIAQTIFDQSHRARMLTLTMRAKPTKSVAEHRQIIKAIKDGSTELAHYAARAHRVRARDELLPLLGQFGMKHM